nr:hypothetical protein [Brucella anthropi]
MNDKSHLLRFGYAPGNYWFVCRDCGSKHAVGDKRSTRCEACAESLHAQITSVEAVADKHRAMTTLPEEAVKAALETWPENGTPYDASKQMRAALTAALPFLPVQGAVQAEAFKLIERMAFGYEVMFEKLCHISGSSGADQSWYRAKSREATERLSPLHSITTESNKSVPGDCKRQYQDFMARILSALEPSATRELALEERLQAIEQQLVVNLEYFHDEKRILLETLQSHIISHISAIRALSSPGHADAGKVEGDGWLPIESAPTDKMLLLACTDWAPVQELGREVPVKVGYQSFGRWTVFGATWAPTHWRPLPTPPSGEVA